MYNVHIYYDKFKVIKLNDCNILRENRFVYKFNRSINKFMLKLLNIYAQTIERVINNKL